MWCVCELWNTFMTLYTRCMETLISKLIHRSIWAFFLLHCLMCKFERVKYIFQCPSCTSVHFWVKDGICAVHPKLWNGVIVKTMKLGDTYRPWTVETKRHHLFLWINTDVHNTRTLTPMNVRTQTPVPMSTSVRLCRQISRLMKSSQAPRCRRERCLSLTAQRNLGKCERLCQVDDLNPDE